METLSCGHGEGSGKLRGKLGGASIDMWHVGRTQPYSTNSVCRKITPHCIKPGRFI